MAFSVNLIRRLVQIIRPLMDSKILHSLEADALSDVSSEPCPTPIFIVGAPRTGSTLLYQLMLRELNLSYFSNLSELFYAAPFWTTRLSKRWVERGFEKRNLTSTFGFSQGLMGPSESTSIVDSWFSGDPLSGYSVPKPDHLRKLFNAMEGLKLGPLLIKNMKLGLRVDTIVEVVPEAVFIHISRSPIYTAQSLLLARKKLHGDMNLWWSYNVPGVSHEMSESCYEEVIKQVWTIDTKIENVKKSLGSDRIIDVSYERLTSDTRETLAQIYTSLNDRGIKVRKRRDFSESSFDTVESMNRVSLQDNEWYELVSAYEKVYGKPE